MLKLLKSKKSGIPAINEIVMTFLNVTPKPILLIIFILLITTISSFVIPIFLNLFGYSCVERTTGDVELYQIPFTNLGEKTLLDIQRGFEGVLGSAEYQLPEDPFPFGDKHYLRIPDECFTESTVNGSFVYGYSAVCMDCDTNANFIQGFFTPLDQLVCTDDGVDTRTTVGIANQRFCARCSAPYPYYYNHTNCVNNSQCYFTILNESLIPSVTAEFYKEVQYNRIIGLGGVLRQQDSTEFSNIQCNDNQKPSLYFYSIDVFNKTMWIILIVGWGLMTFAFMYYNAVGLN